MVKFTQDMKDIAEKARPFIMATATRDGKPNGVPIGLVKIISDDEIMLVDGHMHKSRQNIAENPIVAVSFWDLGVRYGYQFKGKARVETSGKLFDEAVEWLKTRAPTFKAKAVIVVKVDEIYYVGSDKDSSLNLAE
jgi:predicted pyridoxine 5'-phosphate oxidase superfamily flavin-nucleotide-binding protein